MTTVFDVPAEPLLQRVAADLRGKAELKAPDWAPFVKTGRHRERPPTNPDWWHVRLAAVLRKVYIEAPIGTERLSAFFGGAKHRGSMPDKAWSGSRAILRTALQQLEGAGLLVTIKSKGRQVTPAGRKLLDNHAFEVKKGLLERIPALAKY